MRKMMMTMAVLRHLLTAAGGALVAGGYTDEGTAHEIVGGILATVGVVLSLTEKRGREAA